MAKRTRTKGGWWTKERQQRAYSVLRDKAKLSDAGARALVSRWKNVEARQGPTAKNPFSGAIGIGQWLGDRKKALGGSLDFETQLAHAVRELNGIEKRAGDLLRNASTLEEGAVGASAFERAEGYNRRTKRDNFVNATLRGMPHIATAEAAKPAGGLLAIERGRRRILQRLESGAEPVAQGFEPGPGAGLLLVESELGHGRVHTHTFPLRKRKTPGLPQGFGRGDGAGRDQIERTILWANRNQQPSLRRVMDMVGRAPALLAE